MKTQIQTPATHQPHNHLLVVVTFAATFLFVIANVNNLNRYKVGFHTPSSFEPINVTHTNLFNTNSFALATITSPKDITEQEITIEKWMATTEHWAVIDEPAIIIEKWMSNTSLWLDAEINEPLITLEDWMWQPDTWTTNIATEQNIAIEPWMTNTADWFNASTIEPPIAIEPWMSNPNTWANNPNALLTDSTTWAKQ
jgi:hypothetical protein